MSYAQVAANNAPPPHQQPRPDQSLLNTTPPSSNTSPDDTTKVNLLHPSFKDQMSFPDQNPPTADDRHKSQKSRRIQEVEAEGAYLWQVTKRYLFRPGVAGGLIGLLNLGLAASAGHAFYTQPHLRNDRKAISSTLAAALALVTVEGYAAEKYRQTPRGQEEERRAKEEGTLIYKHLREIVLRPGVLGGLLGLVNTAILAIVGYYSYINWEKPTWDRRTVSAVSIGLLTICGGEGLLAEQFREQRRGH